MTSPKSSVQIKVPATIGNVGPGFDCLGLALTNLEDTVTLRLNQSKNSIIESITGLDAEAVPKDPKQNAVTIAAHYYLSKKNLPTGVDVQIHRALPAAGGLGASAAAAVAGAYGAAMLTAKEPNPQDILEAALHAEAHCAGPHLDNIAPCFLGGLTLCISTTPIQIESLPIAGNSWHIAVLTPDVQVKTSEARGLLPHELPLKNWTEQLALSVGLSTALATSNSMLLARCLQDPFAEPRRQKLVPSFKAIKGAALESGALGATFSGAGPTIFAVCDSAKKAAACLQAMKVAAKSFRVAQVCGVNTQGVQMQRIENELSA